MDIQVAQGSIVDSSAEALAVMVGKNDTLQGLAAQIDQTLGGPLADAMNRGEFKAGVAEAISFPGSGSLAGKRIIFVGAGKADAMTPETLRRVAGKATRTAASARFASVSLAGVDDVAPYGQVDAALAGEALAQGSHLSTYRFIEYKTSEEDTRPSSLTSVTLLAPANDGPDGPFGDGVRTGRIVADGARLAMNMANHPAATATPQRMADEAADLAREYGMTLEVLDEVQMKEMGMGGMIGVGQGSARPPRFIVLEHKGAEGDPVVLVGKTITFDTGGISIKPSAGMEEMKGDMSGGAAVLGTMRAIGEMNLPIRVVGILVAAENMPSSTATNPGDVLNMLSGLTVEVINTDAEGRLVLADGLAYAQRYNPRALVDIATLTGACVVALGHHAIGMMGTSKEHLDSFREIGEVAGERVWEMPLWEEYYDDIKSDIADIKNTGGRAGGTITAGCFLRRFAGDAPWVHLDIASTAWGTKATDYLPKGSNGVGVRLLTGFVRKLAAE